MTVYDMAAYDDNGLQGLELGDLKYLQTFCCSMIDMHFVLDITIDWLGKQLEGLPPSHPLDHLVFEFTNPPDEFPESWTRFDETLHTKQRVQVIFNMHGRVDNAAHRHAVSSALARSDQAGLVSFGISRG